MVEPSFPYWSRPHLDEVRVDGVEIATPPAAGHVSLTLKSDGVHVATNGSVSLIPRQNLSSICTSQVTITTFDK